MQAQNTVSERIGTPRNERIQNERPSLLVSRSRHLILGDAVSSSWLAEWRLKFCMNLLMAMSSGARIIKSKPTQGSPAGLRAIKSKPTQTVQTAGDRIPFFKWSFNGPAGDHEVG